MVIDKISGYIVSPSKSEFAFYHFDFTIDIKTKSLSCLRPIVLQLAEQTADTSSLEILQKTYATGTPPPQELLEALISTSSKFNRVYVVVDALDEFTDQEELFELLSSIRDWLLECLSVLDTSRDEPDMRDCVDPAADQEVSLENTGIDNDTMLFVVKTLRKDKKLQARSELFPETEKALMNGAQGMFR